jgi:hypothetical protein
MTLPVLYEGCAEGNLGTSTPEVVRAKTLAKVESDETLSP